MDLVSQCACGGGIFLFVHVDDRQGHHLLMCGAVNVFNVPEHVTNNDFDSPCVDKADLLNPSTFEEIMERLLHNQ